MGHLILIGYMGTGKSRVGEVLSERTGMSFIDLDQRIEAKSSKSIPEIFRMWGEERFREWEKKILEESLNEEDAVIACGGGTPCDTERLSMILKEGTVFLLEATPETISKRLRDEADGRPKLKNSDPRWIAEQLAERSPYYRKAHYKVQVDARTPEAIAERILDLYCR